MFIEKKSSILIILACLLWALDLVVRYPVTLKLSFVNIVFLESLLGLTCMLPWFRAHGRRHLRRFTFGEWLLAAFVGGVGMTVAGYLFTICIQKATPGTFSFFQIFQPLFVVWAAHKILKEKVDNLYLFWGLWVIISALMMYSQDIELGLLANDLFAHPVEMGIAVLTMLIWGLCTVAAKKLLMRHNPVALVGLRWMFSFIFAGAFLLFEQESIPWQQVVQWDFAWRFFFMSVPAGLVAMYLYYSGLKGLPAGQVSFIELSYPAFGLILSSLYTFEGMTMIQLIGGASFFAFICLLLSRQGPSGQPA